jgi:hypothetical protein
MGIASTEVPVQARHQHVLSGLNVLPERSGIVVRGGGEWFPSYVPPVEDVDAITRVPF